VAGFPFFGATPATTAAFSTEIDGANFIQSSVVRWNGQDRVTTFISSSRLTFQVTDADVAQIAIVPVTVFNPAPGGGLSNAVPFLVTPTPKPSVDPLSPQPVAGTGPATFAVSGTGFVGGSVVRWNGQDRPTTLDPQNSTLHVTLSAADLAIAGIATLTAFNPQGGGLSNAVPVFVGAPGASSSLAVNRLIFDSTRQLIIASVGAAGGAQFANHIVLVDPVTTNVVSSVAVGTEPDQLALSDDGSTLWIGLDGPSAIQKVSMATLTAGPVIPLGTVDNLPMSVDSMAVVPGQPDSVVIARKVNLSPRHAGVAVYDNGVQRGAATSSPPVDGPEAIVFGGDATTVYGVQALSPGSRLHRLHISATGVTDVDATDLPNATGSDLKFANGRVYLDDGSVIDPVAATPVVLGKFVLPPFVTGFPGFEPSPAENRMFFFTQPTSSVANGTMRIFDLTTFALLSVVPLTTAPPQFDQQLTRFTPDMLALRDANGQLAFVRSTAVLPPPGFSIISSQLPATTGNKHYQYTLATDGGFEPIVWTISNGALPSGLAVGTGGLISGLTAKVTADQLSSFTVKGTDAIGATASAPLSILVKAGALASNDTCSAATPISNGIIHGSLSPHGDIDVYSFTGTQGATVSIDTLGQPALGVGFATPTSEIDTVVELLDSTCNQITFNDDANVFTLGSQLSFTLPTTGTYFVRVSDARGDGRPEFTYDLQLSGAK
jgi:hypothetical protein